MAEQEFQDGKLVFFDREVTPLCGEKKPGLIHTRIKRLKFPLQVERLLPMIKVWLHPHKDIVVLHLKASVSLLQADLDRIVAEHGWTALGPSGFHMDDVILPVLTGAWDGSFKGVTPAASHVYDEHERQRLQRMTWESPTALPDFAPRLALRVTPESKCHLILEQGQITDRQAAAWLATVGNKVVTEWKNTGHGRFRHAVIEKVTLPADYIPLEIPRNIYLA